jgi:hemerythrin superfamily protein
MDAIQLLKKDHRAVEALFARYEKLGDGAAKQKKAIVAKLIHELSIHASIEEELLYPAARAAVKAKDDLVLESLEEHHLVKVTLSELQSLSPTSERYDAKVTVLKEAISHHVEEEESDLFPAIQKKLGKQVLDQLGIALAAAKKLAPTRPHPNAPDEPPGNILAALPAALVDRLRDFIARPAKSASKKPAPPPVSRARRSMSVGATMQRIGRAVSPPAAAKKKSAPKRGSKAKG